MTYEQRRLNKISNYLIPIAWQDVKTADSFELEIKYIGKLKELYMERANLRRKIKLEGLVDKLRSQ